MGRFPRNILLAVVVLGVIALWTKPGYIEFNIPVPNHDAGGGFWLWAQRSELAERDSGGVLYV